LADQSEGDEMVKWLSQVRDRRHQRRAARRATRGERALRRSEAKALRLRHERFDDKGGPLSGGF
jgi:hypothetical protein